MSNIKPQIISRILALIFLTSAISYSQNPGEPVNFSIRGDIYSGTFSSNSDDWFQGTAPGLAMIDESNTATFLAFTEDPDANMAFDVRSPYNQYEVVNGFLLYDAIYGRDYVNHPTATLKNDQTTFAGNSGKNGQSPQSTWVVDMGGTPTASIDLVDVYAHLRRAGTTVGENMWLAMGLSTMGNTGTHYVDFELYLSDISVSGSSFVNSGPAATGGHTAWVFDAGGNIIDSGDMYVGFAYTGSVISGVELRIWTSRVAFNTINPVGFNWGTQFDGDGLGSTYGYAQIVIPAGSIYDSGNNVLTPAPPWKTLRDKNPAASSTYEIGAFAEVAINISALGIDPSLATNNPCDAPFQKILIKSRSSSSFSSNLKDFAGPYAFLGTPIVDTTIKIADPGYYVCGATETTLSPLNPRDGAYYIYRTLDGEFSNGLQEYHGENATITKHGTYTLTAAPLAGCTESTSSVTVHAQPCAIDDNMGEVVESGTIIDTVTYNVLDNDSDLDDLNSILILTEYTAPSNGTITIDATHGEITYTPNPGFYGIDSFEYQICDDTPSLDDVGPLCDIATVTIIVLEDVDDDGVGNNYDLDNDNDGIPDTEELQCTADPNPNLVIDGDFEDVNIVTSGLDDDPLYDKTSLPTPGIWRGDVNYIPGWESLDTGSDGLNHFEIWQEPNYNADYTVNNNGAYTGIQFSEVVARTPDGYYQDVATTPGDVLRWSFAHRNRSSGDDVIAIVIGEGGDPHSLTVADMQGVFTTAPNYAWLEHYGFYTVPAGQTTTRIWFTALPAYGGSTGSNFIDNVEFNVFDSCYDADADGIPNYLDLDSDNDGIPDVLEAGLTDGNNDGLVDDGVDFTPDYGINGLANIVETFDDSGIINYTIPNTDAASDKNSDFILYNFLDVDSDNDGLTDTKEAFSNNTLYNDVANDGQIDNFVDSDSNGWHDPISTEDYEDPGFVFNNLINSDSDSIPNYLDLDSDGDGLPDTLEANFDVNDSDNDGIVGNNIPNDTDGDGLADTNDPDFTANILGGAGFNQDRDGDGVKDYMDIDVDNDGIVDNSEGQGTFIYVAPLGTDTDGDGLDDAYDVDNGGVGIGYINTGGSSSPDFADTDSDGDLVFDILENNINNTLDDNDLNGVLDSFVDSDGDGLADVFDNVNGTTDTTNAINGGQTPLTQPDVIDVGGDRDWREQSNQDYDLDGIPDTIDLDDDNDGILDTVEDLDEDGDLDPRTNPSDTDGDGVPNYFDLDSDGDGLTDTYEAGGTFDTDGSGMPRSGILVFNTNATLSDVGINPGVDYGIPDDYTILYGAPYPQNGIIPQDTDGDLIPDYLDLDSDNDGISDVLEAGGVDGNEDGLYGSGAAIDSDADGLSDAVDPYNNSDLSALGTPLTTLVGAYHQAIDTDGDTNPNFLDLDSDNDTIPDNIEGQSTLGYLIPTIDDGLTILVNEADLDGDGLNESYDISNGGTPIVPVDTDGDGTPDYLDLNSDNELDSGGNELYDIIEAHDPIRSIPAHTNGVTNGTPGANGFDDVFDGTTDDFVDPNGVYTDPRTNFPDADSDLLYGGDVDYRDAEFSDNDNDGISDPIDLDDDNDGILDTVESNGVDPLFDTDENGISDYLDEDYCTSLSSTLNSFGVCSYFDTDDDGIPNFFDLDSDADGCNDVLEAYNIETADSDNDGIYGTGAPTVDAEGLVTAAGVTSSTYNTLPADTDTSTIDDFLESTVYVACKADLDLVKTVEDSSGNPITQATIDQTIIFTLTLTNNGPYETKGVQVLDNMPVGLIYQSHSTSYGTFDPGTGIWDLGAETTIGVSTSAELTITVKGGPNCGPITNYAEITHSDRLDPDSLIGNGN